ncbi:MAG: biotin transporter BioY [Ruminococcaceae bacterium]|nr:biotin transporter BioY [Oscillospiraceae bacterium]
MMNSVKRIKFLTVGALFATLMVIGSYIRIPLPLLTMTMQTFFVLLCGFLLGGKGAFFSMFLYLCMGLLGLPVFSEGGGIGYVLKPSFGFIIGFCIGAFVTGFLAKKSSKSFIHLFLCGCVGLAVIYTVGLLHYTIISCTVLDVPVSIRSLFMFCFLLPLPGDIISCFLATTLAKRLSPIFREFEFFHENKKFF